MLGFNHALTGSIIAVIIPAPLVPLIALASHFLLDVMPHFGRSETFYPYTNSFKRLLVADALLCFAALGLAVVLFPDKWLIICVGAFFAAFPDFLWIFHHRGSRIMDKFLDWAEWIQWGERPYGWLFDAVYGILMCITLYLLSH